MELNEKLEFISAMESEGYNQDVIECLVEGIEHPEYHYVGQKFSSGKAALDNILGHAQVEG